MKKIFMFFFGILCVVAFFFGCAQDAEGKCHLIWTLSCFAVSFFSGWLFGVIGDKEGRKNA